MMVIINIIISSSSNVIVNVGISVINMISYYQLQF